MLILGCVAQSPDSNFLETTAKILVMSILMRELLRPQIYLWPTGEGTVVCDGQRILIDPDPSWLERS